MDCLGLNKKKPAIPENQELQAGKLFKSYSSFINLL
jgi:hypothetical protein